MSVLFTFLGSNHLLSSTYAPPPPVLHLPHMVWGTERGGAYHPTLADQQQQQPPQQQQQQQPPQQQEYQQQRGPSPRALQAFDLYRVCVAMGHMARFTVVQRPEGEFFTLSSRPPPPHSAAAARGRGPGRRPNKKRVDKQRARRERLSSMTAAQSQQQPQRKSPGQDPQQQQQKQATASSSCTPQRTFAAAASSAPQQRPQQQSSRAAGVTQHNQAAKLAAAIPMETRSSKKRRIALSPGGATVTATADMPLPGKSPPPSTPLSGDAIPQLDGAEETPSKPPAPQDRDTTPGSETPPERCLRPAPPPPPMTRLTRCPYLVLCRRCSERTHNIAFKYCNRCIW